MQLGSAIIEQIRVMLIDDDDAVRDAVAEILARRGWRVDAFDNAEGGLAALKAGEYDVVLTDINMPGLSGMDFLNKAKEAVPGVPVVMITGYPSIDMAVEAMKIGAVDFLTKPFKSEEIEIIVRKAVSNARANREHNKAAESNVRAIGNMPQVARRRLEDKIKELSILHTISETMDDIHDKEDIFRKTMDIAQIITDAEKVFVMVVEQESKEVIIRASSGYDDVAIEGISYTTGDEPFKSVIENKCYSYLNVDEASFKGLVGFDKTNIRWKSMLLAPMLINREVVVILGLTGMDSSREVTNDTMTLLLNLTSKASMKLENIALSENIFNNIIGALNSLINALDARDTYTKDHSHRVTEYALMIARSYSGCTQDVLDSINFAGPLHDIGKIAVRDDILLKKGAFSDEERAIMMSHVSKGEEILKPLNLLTSERSVVLHHHERYDGKGYPNGLTGTDIPLVARIFSIADTFDAMTSTRPYRSALSVEIARNEIINCKGTQFDPDIVDAFLDSEILTKKKDVKE